MAYLQVHQSLPTHRKTYALADTLGVCPACAMGHIVSLWLWAVDNADDGVIEDLRAETIARICGYDGDCNALRHALVTSGFCDTSPLRIHDWDEYVVALREIEDRRRAKTLERVRQYRLRKAAGKAEETPGVTRDVTRTKTPCNAQEERREEKSSGEKNTPHTSPQGESEGFRMEPPPEKKRTRKRPADYGADFADWLEPWPSTRHGSIAIASDLYAWWRAQGYSTQRLIAARDAYANECEQAGREPQHVKCADTFLSKRAKFVTQFAPKEPA